MRIMILFFVIQLRLLPYLKVMLLYGENGQLSPILLQRLNNKPYQDIYKKSASINQMGSKEQSHLNLVSTPLESSLEHKGAHCFFCNVQLPPNNKNFDILLGFFCFYDLSEGGWATGFKIGSGQSSQPFTVNHGTKLYKYFRRDKDQKYKCASCFTKTEDKDICRSLDLFLQGKGVVTAPNQVKGPNEITLTSWQYGLRLCGHPNAWVDVKQNNQFWQKWELEHKGENRYHLKSKTHGTYLRAYPDGHLDLTTNKSQWETWIKKDYGHYHTWKSHHGGYLSCNQKGAAYLMPKQTPSEYWIDI